MMLAFMQHQVYITDFSAMIHALPYVITAFGFQIIVPTLCGYLKDTPSQMPSVLALGSLLALLIYGCWVFAVYAVAPMQGKAALSHVAIAAISLKQLPGLIGSWMGGARSTDFVNFFIFSGIATSYLGISLGLYHFLKDALMPYGQWGSKQVCLLFTFVLPLLMVFISEHVFMIALRYAGFLVAMLNGLLPCAMFYVKRDQLCYSTPLKNIAYYWLPLVYTALYAVLVMVVDLWGI